MEKILRVPWQVPFGELSLKLDPMSFLFLAAILILGVCAGIYGVGYMRGHGEKRALAGHFVTYLLLLASMALVVTANNVILFLAAWETMSLAVYFLIVFEGERSSVRKAGFLYLAASHCGTFCLFVMFFFMAQRAGSMDFDVISRAAFSPAAAGAIFVLSVLGFGVKAGFLPMHIWLPRAHPAAPSHISAILSGVAIKAGIYGICRVIWMTGSLPEWCGYALLALGIVSGVMGVLYALGQHELKKLLAYHSIENIGIITIGLGLGLLGMSHHAPALAAFGFAGGLLHVLNHSLFKGLLFLSAGAVIQKTRTGEMDRMGGLSRAMPVTGALFLTGALAICGLPLFNGFISEFIIFSGLFRGLSAFSLSGVYSCALGILSLALMGALALACFTKVYGTVFSGTPRDPRVVYDTGDPSRLMLVPMLVLAALCLWIGLAPWAAVNAAFAGGGYLARVLPADNGAESVLVPLSGVAAGAMVFCGLVLILFMLKRKLSVSRVSAETETWGCGYAREIPRAQYTSSSFARPIVDFVRGVLGGRRQGGRVSGNFPEEAHLSSSVHDVSEEKLFRPLFDRLTGLSRMADNSRIRYTQMYLMYIFVFLVFLLFWKMR